MPTPVFLSVAALLWVASSMAAQSGPGTVQAAASNPKPLATAIEAGLSTPGTPFRLWVDCTDESRSRSLELFPSGIAIWNKRAQVTLTEAARSSLLKVLLDSDFSGLAPRYGGHPESPEREAALRISCRVEIEIDDLRQGSIQLVDGEQSLELAALAAALLDRIEPIARSANTVARDLEDGLTKLAGGELAPETFELRWVRLPSAETESLGAIFRVAAGRESWQAYAPGRQLGETVSRELDTPRLLELIAAVRRAEIWTWPLNLWSDAYAELEIRVLDHHQAIIARPFSRLSPTSLGRTQEQFDLLASELLNLESSLAQVE